MDSNYYNNHPLNPRYPAKKRSRQNRTDTSARTFDPKLVASSIPGGSVRTNWL